MVWPGFTRRAGTGRPATRRRTPTLRLEPSGSNVTGTPTRPPPAFVGILWMTPALAIFRAAAPKSQSLGASLTSAQSLNTPNASGAEMRAAPEARPWAPCRKADRVKVRSGWVADGS
jgi:hypothetical protein